MSCFGAVPATLGRQLKSVGSALHLRRKAFKSPEEPPEQAHGLESKLLQLQDSIAKQGQLLQQAQDLLHKKEWQLSHSRADVRALQYQQHHCEQLLQQLSGQQQHDKSGQADVRTAADWAGLIKTCTDLQRSAARHHVLRDEVKQLKQDLRAAEQQSIHWERSSYQAHGQLAALTVSDSTSQQALQEQTAVTQQLQQQLNSSELRCSELAAAKRQLGQSSTASQEEIVRLREILASSELCTQQVQAELAAAHDEASRLREDTRNHEETALHASAELTAAKHDIALLKAQLKEAEVAAAAAHDVKDELQSSLDAATVQASKQPIKVGIAVCHTASPAACASSANHASPLGNGS